MPKTKSAKKVMDKMKDQYGEKEGERVYYATANKQGRDEKTFKKESVELLDDVVFENNGMMTVLPKGTILTEMAVGTGSIAMVPNVLGGKPEDEDEDEKNKKVEEKSDKKWIQKAIKRPGALKAKDPTPDTPLTNKDLDELEKDGSTRTKQQVNLARNLKKMNEEEIDEESNSQVSSLQQDH